MASALLRGPVALRNGTVLGLDTHLTAPFSASSCTQPDPWWRSAWPCSFPFGSSLPDLHVCGLKSKNFGGGVLVLGLAVEKNRGHYAAVHLFALQCRSSGSAPRGGERGSSHTALRTALWVVDAGAASGTCWYL